MFLRLARTISQIFFYRLLKNILHLFRAMAILIKNIFDLFVSDAADWGYCVRHRHAFF